MWWDLLPAVFQILYDESVQQPWGLSIIVPGNNLFVFGFCLACELPLNFFFTPDQKKKKAKERVNWHCWLGGSGKRESASCAALCAADCQKLRHRVETSLPVSE